MKTLSSLPLALVLALLPAIATAQQATYQVSGDAISGTATVTPHRFAKAMFKVRLQVETINGANLKKNAVRTIEAWGHRTASGELRFAYYNHVKRTRSFLSGAKRFVEDPLGLLNGRNPYRYTESVRVSVRMKPVGDGRYRGDVDGVTQTWTPAGPTSDVVVLVVPGLSTNNWNRFGIPYLDENLAALRARNLIAYRVEIKTEDGVLKNARFIKAEIEKMAKRNRRVIIMAHSKGATDATAALALYPALRPHVAGLIGIQPVYGGSPIADIVANNGALTGMVKLVFEGVFKGQRQAVIDLSFASRKAFVAEHPFPADEIPTVVVQSTFDRRMPSRSVLFLPQKLIEKRFNSPSDGMVKPQDQLIPGAKRVLRYRDLDHFEPGIRVESPHSPTKLTNAALDALWPHLKPKAPAQAR